MNPLHFTDRAGLARWAPHHQGGGGSRLHAYSSVSQQGRAHPGWSADVQGSESADRGCTSSWCQPPAGREALAKLRSWGRQLESPALGSEFEFTPVVAASRYALAGQPQQGPPRSLAEVMAR